MSEILFVLTHIGRLSWNDVHEMTRGERSDFIGLLADHKKRIADSIKK